MDLTIFNESFFLTVEKIMVVLAVVVFAALQYFKAGYGYLRSKGWGPMIDNKLGWVLMEIPVLIVTALIYIYAQGWQRPTATVLVSFLVVHYIQRSLVYPFLMRGKSKIPITVVLMGAVFNVINAYLISGWLFILKIYPELALLSTVHHRSAHLHLRHDCKPALGLHHTSPAQAR